MIGVPGASAQIEFDRRATKDKANRDAALLDTISRALLAGTVVGVLVEVVAHWGGLMVGSLFATVFLLGKLAPRMSTHAWSIGAAGEVRTATLLDPLAEHGFVVMHDLRISRSRANIDHLVIGPTGVFVVETKNVQGRVRIDGRDVRMGGRRVGVVEEVHREVAEVDRVLGPTLSLVGVPIHAIVVAHRAELPLLFRTAAGIKFVYPNKVRNEISKRAVVLSPEQIARLRAAAERFLRPRQRAASAAPAGPSSTRTTELEHP